jgi:hypothetical protein
MLDMENSLLHAVLHKLLLHNFAAAGRLRLRCCRISTCLPVHKVPVCPKDKHHQKYKEEQYKKIISMIACVTIMGHLAKR